MQRDAVGCRIQRTARSPQRTRKSHRDSFRQVEELSVEVGKVQDRSYSAPLSTVVQILNAHSNSLDLSLIHI